MLTRSKVLALAAALVLGCGASSAGPTIDANTQTRGLVRVTLPQVRLVTDAPASEAEELALRMQWLHDSFASDVFTCASDLPHAPLHVVALEDARHLEALSSEWVGGFFRRSGVSWFDDVIVLRLSDDEGRATRTFAHELAHSFIARCYPRMPLWLNEGLAKVLETAQLRPSGQLVIGRAAFLYGDIYGFGRRGERWVTVLPRDLLPTVDEMRWMTATDFYAERYTGLQAQRMRAEHYGGAWGAVHMLMLGDRVMRAGFDRYLSALRSSARPEPALWREAFGGLDVDVNLRVYRRRSRIRSFPFPHRSDAPLAQRVAAERVPPADARLLWAELYLTGGQLTRAERFLDAVRGSSRQMARAPLLRASARLFRNPDADVSPLLDEAVAADPDLLAARHARLAVTGDLGSVASEQDIAALEADVDSAPHLAVVGDARLRRDQSAAALELLDRALALDPTNWRALMSRARALVALGRQAEAVAPYRQAIATLGHSSARGRAVLEEELAEVTAALPEPEHPESYDPSWVHGPIELRRGRMQSCYEGRRSLHPELAGRVTVEIRIATDGSSRVTLDQARTTIDDRPLRLCVLTTMQGLVFRPPRQPLRVLYPFAFSAPDEAEQ